LVPSVKVPPTKLNPKPYIDEVAYTVTLVCTRELNKILGFEIGKRRLRERETEAATTVVVEPREGQR